MKIIWVLVFFQIGILHNLAQQNIEFPQEFIDFSLNRNYFTINGIYRFKNSSAEPVKTTIYFPFAEGFVVDSVSVTNIYEGKTVNYLRNGGGIIFPLNLKSNDSVEYQVFYRQKTAAANTYILTSAQTWGKPLKKANYSLTVFSDVSVDKLSIPPDSMSVQESQKVYFWFKQNFLPETEFTVTIK